MFGFCDESNNVENISLQKCAMFSSNQAQLSIQSNKKMNLPLLCREIATNLVKKLVSVMESVENLPLYLYESPGALYSLQILTKR